MAQILLSGPTHSRLQAVAALRQAGPDVNADDKGSHGFEVQDGEAWIACRYSDVDAAVRAVEPLGWALRSHWVRSGPWRKAGSTQALEAMAELEKMKAVMRSNGMAVD